MCTCYIIWHFSDQTCHHGSTCWDVNLNWSSVKMVRDIIVISGRGWFGRHTSACASGLLGKPEPLSRSYSSKWLWLCQMHCKSSGLVTYVSIESHQKIAGHYSVNTSWEFVASSKLHHSGSDLLQYYVGTWFIRCSYVVLWDWENILVSNQGFWR